MAHMAGKTQFVKIYHLQVVYTNPKTQQWRRKEAS